MQFEVKLQPDIVQVLRVIDEALKTIKDIPIYVWSQIEDEILEYQVQHWEQLKGLALKKSTIKRKARAVKKGKKVVVGRSGRKETPKYVEEAAHFTGFLRDRLATSERIRGYNVKRFENTNGIRRGTFRFGVDPEFYRNEYPGRLAKWISKKKGGIDKFSALIGINETNMQSLALHLWDMMWMRMEEELKGME